MRKPLWLDLSDAGREWGSRGRSERGVQEPGQDLGSHSEGAVGSEGRVFAEDCHQPTRLFLSKIVLLVDGV